MNYFSNINGWLLLGFFSQVAFMGRFVAQWIASEKQGKSVLPISFWYLSCPGSSGLLVYAIVRKDPVFILGQSLGLFIYITQTDRFYAARSFSKRRITGFSWLYLITS